MTTAVLMGATRLRTLVVTGNVLQQQHCALYDDHLSAVIHAHHVCPESWWLKAGVPVGSPLLDVCPTCHYNMHAAIDGIIKGQDISLLPVLCVAQARAAFPIAAANGLTPALTL